MPYLTDLLDRLDFYHGADNLVLCENGVCHDISATQLFQPIGIQERKVLRVRNIRAPNFPIGKNLSRLHVVFLPLLPYKQMLSQSLFNHHSSRQTQTNKRLSANSCKFILLTAQIVFATFRVMVCSIHYISKLFDH